MPIDVHVKLAISSPAMIMLRFTGGKASIIQKPKNYIGSAIDNHYVTAFFVYSAKCEGVGFQLTTIPMIRHVTKMACQKLVGYKK